MTSNITGGETKFLFKEKILNKHVISYYQCQETGYIQTEKPYWLQEAYHSAITKLDIGLIKRNIFILRELINLFEQTLTQTELF